LAKSTASRLVEHYNSE